MDSSIPWRNNNFWYRAIPEDNWISCKDRKPTEADASPDGMIVVFYEKSATQYKSVTRITPFHNGVYNLATHWMPLNFVPREPARIKVDGNELIPQPDGSVKISCGTIIPKEHVEEFIRQYQEVAK